MLLLFPCCTATSNDSEALRTATKNAHNRIHGRAGAFSELSAVRPRSSAKIALRAPRIRLAAFGASEMPNTSLQLVLLDSGTGQMLGIWKLARGRRITIKKPSELRLRRGRRKPRSAKSKPESKTTWYAAAARQIGITSRSDRRAAKTDQTERG